jgi:hypothetical protein
MVFGLTVLWLLVASDQVWGRWGALMHGSFGVFMVAASTFAHRPWDPGLPFDSTEDMLHSIAATAMGFAFAIGVVAVTIHRRPRPVLRRLYDLAAISASVALPLAMAAWVGQAGALQRLMFTIAYVWYGAEALSLHGRRVQTVTSVQVLS